MENKISDNGAIPKHLAGDELISYLDGELSRGEQFEARTHLESCWKCRSQLNVLQSSIDNFLSLRQESLLPGKLPPSGPAVELFRQRLVEHSASPPPQASSWLRIAHWSSVFSSFTSPFKTVLPKLTASPLAARAVVFIFLAVIVGILLLRSNRVPTVSASELLRQATQAQTAELRATSQPVIYQKLQVRRVRQVSGRDSVVSLEIWNDATRPRFRQSVTEGVGRRFLPATASAGIGGRETSSFPEVLLELDQVLRANRMDPQHPLSATSYRSWRDSLGQKQDEVTRTKLSGDIDTLTLRTVPTGVLNVGQITEAVFVVRARDWHPGELRLRVRAEGGDREYEIVETAFEVVSLPRLSSEIFPDQPGAPTASNSIPGATLTGSPSPELSANANGAPMPLPPVRATAELEVEVLRLLNQAGADLGEQVSTRRNSDGLLRVEGIVETESRKAEILRALASVMNHAAVRIEIKTVAEALAEKRGQGRDASRPAQEQKVEIDSGAVAAEGELRSYFKSDEGARQFAARMVSRSQHAMRRLYALKRLSNQFSAEELRAFTPEARAKWLALIRTHARAYLQEASGLRQELQLVFSASAQSAGAQGGPAITDPIDVVHAVEQLFKLGSANDRVILSAFTTSSEGVKVTTIKTGAFWQSLSAAEALAARIQSAQ